MAKKMCLLAAFIVYLVGRNQGDGCMLLMGNMIVAHPLHICKYVIAIKILIMEHIDSCKPVEIVTYVVIKPKSLSHFNVQLHFRLFLSQQY